MAFHEVDTAGAALAKGGGKMWKLFIILIGLCLAVGTGMAQTQFVQTLGGTDWDPAYSLIQTSDDGYVLTGYITTAGAGSGDVLLVKHDASGEIEWARTLGGTDWEQGASVIQADDGGYVVAGWSWGFGAGGEDALIAKFDAFGIHQWTRAAGGPEQDFAQAVVQAEDGGYLIAGATLSYGSGGWALFLNKFDGSGDYEWTTVLQGQGTYIAHDLVRTSDGGYAVAGYTDDFGGNLDGLLVKISDVGAPQWVRAIGGTNPEQTRSLVQTADGGYLLMTETTSYGAGRMDFLFSKFSATGNHEWSRTVGSDGWEYPESGIEMSDGGCVAVGRTRAFGAFEDDFLVVTLDPSGDFESSWLLGGEENDRGTCVIQTTDGGYAATGFTESFGAGAADVLLVKFDASGESCLGDPVNLVAEPIFPTVHTGYLFTENITPTITEPQPTSTGFFPDTTVLCSSGGGFIRGDADSDMDVEMADAIFTLKYLYVPGSPHPTCTDAADSDDGGSVAMADAVYSLKYLYVPGEPPPPPPGPTDCGDDPTSDQLDCIDHPCMGK